MIFSASTFELSEQSESASSVRALLQTQMKSTARARELEVSERIESYLVNLIGYEVWTPLSTLKVTLESLSNSAELTGECQQILLEAGTAELLQLSQLIHTSLNFVSNFHPESSAFTSFTHDLTNILQDTVMRKLEPCHLWDESPKAFFPPVSIERENSERWEYGGERLSKLVAIVGHELRTPLSTIQACLETLVSFPEMPISEKRTMLEIALIDLERLYRLIRDFSTFARLKGGLLYHRSDWLHLADVIDLALSSLRASQVKKAFPQISVQLPPRLPMICTDGDKLVEVLLKLLDNACKFTAPNGSVLLTARLCQPPVKFSGSPSLWLETTIADTGRGIAFERLETIFDPFYQEEASLQRTIGGTGIGLTICRALIRSLGGEIWAFSAGKQQGSQFQFVLPLKTGNSV